jgi:predicted nucleic acid-binding protein
MAFAADSSVSPRWLLPSQTDAPSLAILRKAEREGLFVPALWHLEVANQLGLRLRSGKLAKLDYERALRIIANLDIETSDRVFASPLPILAVMAQYNLTSYDAVHLAFAQTHQLVLATFDDQPRRAARSAGVQSIP